MPLSTVSGYDVYTLWYSTSFTDTLTLDYIPTNGKITIRVFLPEDLPRNTTFDLSLNFNTSGFSVKSAIADFYNSNNAIACDPVSAEVNTDLGTIEVMDITNNKKKLNKIFITLEVDKPVFALVENKFYIHNTEFEYEPGMTWETWKDSDYNNLSDYGVHMYWNGNNVNLQDEDYILSLYNDFELTIPTKKTDIINNQTYYFNSDYPFPLANEEYEFTFSVTSISLNELSEDEISSGILGWIKNIFNSIKNLPQNIANNIKGFFEDLGNKITELGNALLDGIKGLFIPSEESLTEIKEDFEALLADRFGAVYESTAVIDNFANAFFNQAQVSTMSENSGTIHFPLVTVPLAGTDFSFGGWDVDVIPDGFEGIVDTLKLVVDIVCTFVFVNALRKRLEAILR